MTDALYLEDSEQTQFVATVDRIADDRVVLDQTAFYPEGGGQPADTGSLRLEDGDESWSVTDVQKRDTIYHHLELENDTEPPAPGTTVVGELDADRRRAHNRYHTAQHLLSAVLLEEFDAQTTGNQLYADRARLDCAYERFEDADLERLERRLNDLVDDELTVTWNTLDREDAEARLDPDRTRLHLLPESITEVRIVQIGANDNVIDRTACAGTHVENTGEIGHIEVTGRETRGPDEERVRFQLSADPRQ
ncbi:alanyl-tRNA editing protein [Natrialba sp. SSL1]|uniref:alanyl-tRNA editing protein n=1 Tax=Natrialba sp. SSL1 TaxID=1869245 RepID=UPI0008F95D60|nr:alanyl-tRNA editing protein [Natrialba sp. SSL1]OIB58363.1 alanyl-tRNA editing protein [Natrialba sp. SSL1]